MKRTELRLITARNKQAFLDNYPIYKTFYATAPHIGVSDSAITLWCNTDDDFNGKVAEIKKQIEKQDLERAEAELKDRIYDHPTKMSDVLLMFYLKSLDPRYRDRVPETRVVGDITVKLAMPSYREDLRELPKQLT